MIAWTRDPRDQRRFTWDGGGFAITLTRKLRYWIAQIREGDVLVEYSDTDAVRALLGLREASVLSDAAWNATYDCAVAWDRLAR